MTNRTRLDSLQVGERFKMTEADTNVYIHMGYDAPSRLQRYRKDQGPLSVRGDHGSLGEGSTYVVPMDAPPEVPR